MKKIIIAIDGLSSTGKSTIAKRLAKKLGYIYLDTGAMYRAVTLYAMKRQLIGDSFFKVDELIDNLNDIDLKFSWNTTLGFSEIFLNGQNVENQIRTFEVSEFVSKVSSVLEVREKLVAQQRKIGKDKGIVMDGRDIGTVVFPDAELKIFMRASAEKRAERRYKELEQKGQQINYDSVLQSIIERDRADSQRLHSPLIKAKDAVVFDNSEMTIEEQLEQILKLV